MVPPKIKSLDYPVEYTIYVRRQGAWQARTRYNTYLGFAIKGENRSKQVADFLSNFRPTYIPTHREFEWSVY